MELYGEQKSKSRFLSLYDNCWRGILAHVMVYINVVVHVYILSYYLRFGTLTHALHIVCQGIH